MILLTNGCSFTAGGGLETVLNTNDSNIVKQYTWPKYLGEMFHALEVVNLGRGCGSNQRVLRTTFDWLSTSNYKPKDIVVVIQWTEPSRFEFYDQIIHKGDADNLDRNWRQVKMNMNEIQGISEKEVKKEIEFTDKFISMYTSRLSDAYQLVMNCTSMIGMLNYFGIKKYFFWTEKNWYQPIPNHLQTYLNDIPIFILDNPKLDYLPDAHPSIKGHQQIAQILYNKIVPKNDTSSSI